MKWLSLTALHKLLSVKLTIYPNGGKMSNNTYQLEPSGRSLDSKRYLWLASPILPLLPLLGLWFYHLTASEWVLAFPLVLSYIGLPLLDLIFGEDESNPADSAIEQLENDSYYRWLTYLTVPTHFISLFAFAIFVGTTPVSIAAVIVLALSSGAFSGLAINTSHELGHKKSRFEKALARITLAVPFYGHFCIEHNRGHHRDVATPEDPASSRMGESIYRFMIREIPGTLKRGWNAEIERLARLNLPPLSFRNHILQSYFISILIYLVLTLIYGWLVLLFLMIQTSWAWFQLTSANYIEHYGLLRERMENGRYESCKPHHSWNANSLASNVVLFQLERHSDHHANPTRRYQSLRNFAGIPQLPTGYFGMYLVAYIPALWFKIMDKRLLATPNINGDLSKVNIDPAQRQKIYAKYA